MSRMLTFSINPNNEWELYIYILGTIFPKFELYYLTAHHCNEIMTKHFMIHDAASLFTLL